MFSFQKRDFTLETWDSSFKNKKTPKKHPQSLTLGQTYVWLWFKVLWQFTHCNSSVTWLLIFVMSPGFRFFPKYEWSFFFTFLRERRDLKSRYHLHFNFILCSIYLICFFTSKPNFMMIYQAWMQGKRVQAKCHL